MDLKEVLHHLITMTRWNSESEQIDARAAVDNHFAPAEAPTDQAEKAPSADKVGTDQKASEEEAIPTA